MSGLTAACAAEQRAYSSGSPDGGLAGEFAAVSPTLQIMAPGTQRDLTVSYLGGYPAGSFVEFAVVASDLDYNSTAAEAADAGAPAGGSLMPTTVELDSEGIATTTLTVGTTPGKFRVRARIAGITPIIYFDVEVSEAYLPALSVKVKYDGVRSVASRSAAALPKTTCAQAVSANKSSGEVRTVEAPLDVLSFSLVPDQSYAIVAWGRDSTYAEVATGCQEVLYRAPAEQAEASKSIVVTIEDKPMRLSADSYPVELALNVDASMARLSGIAQSQAATLFPSGQYGEAKGYLDVVHDVLVAQNQTAKAADLDSRLTAGTVNVSSLADVLSTNKAGFVATASALSTLLTSVGKNLAVHAGYGVGASGVPMTLSVGALLARSEDGSLAFDLMAVSGAMAPTATIVASFDDARAEVDVQTLSIALGLGTYGRALLEALGKDDAKWTVTRFSGAAGCTPVANWLSQETTVRDGSSMPLCDKACTTSVCSEITSRVVEATRGGFTVQLDGEHSAISLMGKVSAHDRIGDDAVDDLGPSPLSGNWGKAPGAGQEDAVTGLLAPWSEDESTAL